jgi:hypothetical protein
MLIAYAIVGFIVYVTLLLLGEMATQYPVAGTLSSCKALYPLNSHSVYRQAHSTRTRTDFFPLRTLLHCHIIIGSTTPCLLLRT